MRADPSVIWAMFYANLAAMRMHPGYEKAGKLPMHLYDLELMANAADNMLEHYIKRFGEAKCLSSQEA